LYNSKQRVAIWLEPIHCQMTEHKRLPNNWNTNESLKWKFRFTGFIFYIFLNKSCKNIRVRTKIYWSCAGGPLLIAVDFFFFIYFESSSHKTVVGFMFLVDRIKLKLDVLFSRSLIWINIISFANVFSSSHLVCFSHLATCWEFRSFQSSRWATVLRHKTIKSLFGLVSLKQKQNTNTSMKISLRFWESNYHMFTTTTAPRGINGRDWIWFLS
jgi:hypothetical protein